jgi:hypothetical protein
LIVTRSRRYSDHVEVLLALITYLGLTSWRSRTPNGLARDLRLDEGAVTEALELFPGLFRRGLNNETPAGLQPSYTLHARYAQRRPRDASAAIEGAHDGGTPSPNHPRGSRDGRGEELDVDTLRTLLDFVTQEARAERAARQQRHSQVWVVVGVAVAAITSVVAAVIQASS